MKFCLRQNTRIETLTARVASLKKSRQQNSAQRISALQSELAAENRKFDVELERLDSCTQVLEVLNKKADSARVGPVRTQ